MTISVGVNARYEQIYFKVPIVNIKIHAEHIYSAVQHSIVQHNAVQYSTVQCSTVQYSTVQHNAVQYSTVQHNAVQYSTVQHSTVQCSAYCTIVINNSVLHGYILY